MTTRESAPIGSPCWADLWTSDVEGSAKFYCELFGWEAQEPSPEFGGYFMFTREGIPVAGGMGDMEGVPANNTWKIYLATDDVERTLGAAKGDGAEVALPAMAVADLGIQAVLVDPTGATVGAWQPGTFPGFAVLDEHGAPSWFELYTRDFGRAVGFYESVFGWKTSSVGDTDEFRYTVMLNPDAEGELAGVMDAGSFLADGDPAYWSVYWEVDNVDDSAVSAGQLGGSVVMAPHDTPYGRIAAVVDPTGARFNLRTKPS